MLTREVTSPRSWLPAILLAVVSSGLAMLLAAGMMLALAGCGVSDFIEDPNGTVYTCTDGSRVEEWCAVISADELGAARDLDCHETGVGDRWWPGVTNALGHGCDYSCDPHVGCNAHQGCWGCP